MDGSTATRRRSPQWVRDLSIISLHRIGGKLMNEFRTDGLTDRQYDLLSSILSELEYRWRRSPSPDRCVCQLCFVPFPE